MGHFTLEFFSETHETTSCVLLESDTVTNTNDVSMLTCASPLAEEMHSSITSNTGIERFSQFSMDL